MPTRPSWKRNRGNFTDGGAKAESWKVSRNQQKRRVGLKKGLICRNQCWIDKRVNFQDALSVWHLEGLGRRLVCHRKVGTFENFEGCIREWRIDSDSGDPRKIPKEDGDIFLHLWSLGKTILKAKWINQSHFRGRSSLWCKIWEAWTSAVDLGMKENSSKETQDTGEAGMKSEVKERKSCPRLTEWATVVKNNSKRS